MAGSLTVRHRGPDGTRMLVEQDVLRVCDRLREYDPRMYLEVGKAGSPAEGKFFVMMEMDDGRVEQLLTWDCAQGGPLTAEIIDRLWQGDAWRPGNDPIKNWFEETARREAAEEAALDEKVREEIAPKLVHALRKDGVDVGFSPLVNPGWDGGNTAEKEAPQ